MPPLDHSFCCRPLLGSLEEDMAVDSYDTKIWFLLDLSFISLQHLLCLTQVLPFPGPPSHSCSVPPTCWGVLSKQWRLLHQVSHKTRPFPDLVQILAFTQLGAWPRADLLSCSCLSHIANRSFQVRILIFSFSNISAFRVEM